MKREKRRHVNIIALSCSGSTYVAMLLLSACHACIKFTTTVPKIYVIMKIINAINYQKMNASHNYCVFCFSFLFVFSGIHTGRPQKRKKNNMTVQVHLSMLLFFFVLMMINSHFLQSFSPARGYVVHKNTDGDSIWPLSCLIVSFIAVTSCLHRFQDVQPDTTRYTNRQKVSRNYCKRSKRIPLI